MKIEYHFEEEKIYETSGPLAIPAVGHMVYFKEIFYVENVVWYPEINIVRIYLIDELPKQPNMKVAESANNIVKLDDVRRAQSTADKALKESTNLKRQLFSIRQFLRAKPNDTSTR